MNAAQASVPIRARLLAIAERRLPALTRLKQPEPLPIRLHRQRIYVLPTRFGLLFSAVLTVMLLGALNYNNNPALLLTCLLGAASYQSVFQAYRMLDRVELHAVQVAPCHAGELLRLGLSFTADARRRLSLRASCGGQETLFDVPREGAVIHVSLGTQQRGWIRPGRILLRCEYPFGLFQVWSWLNPDFAALVYPRLEEHAAPLPLALDAAAERPLRRAGDEFGMLRDYHPSDPRRSIAWKASARHDSLLVKEFEQRRGDEIVLDWDATRALPYEARISRLARWVCEAEAASQRYTLRVPGETIGPGQGTDHRHACLRALALMPGAAA